MGRRGPCLSPQLRFTVLCSPPCHPGEVQWPYCPLQVDLHRDAMAANQQIRLGHHEPGRQPDQTGRASTLVSHRCPLVPEANEPLCPDEGMHVWPVANHGGRHVLMSLSSDLHVAVYQVVDSLPLL